MLNTQSHKVRSLERQAEHLYCIIAAAEPWATEYTKDTETHAAIIKHEARLERLMRGYFRDLITRLPNYINWTTYSTKVMQAYDVNVIVNDDQFGNEDGILISLVTDITADGVAIGANAGESIYNAPIGLTPYSEVVQTTARKLTSAMVTHINATTRDYLQSSLDTSIRNGESTDEAAARINKRLGDPRRAMTIARTESVTAYQGGMLTFGKASGAIGREWQATHGACPICSPLDGMIAKINDNFNSEVGANPPAHPNCRCGQRMIYQNELDDNPKLFTPPNSGITNTKADTSYTISHQGFDHKIELTKGEVNFMKASGLQVEVDTTKKILTKATQGMYRPAEHKMFVKIPTANMSDDYDKTFRHELGHAIDFKYTGYRLSNNDAASAIVSDKLAVVKARILRMAPDIPDVEVSAYARGHKYKWTNEQGQLMSKGFKKSYTTYLRSKTEVFADGYAQYRLDPVAFESYAPALTKIYKELKI